MNNETIVVTGGSGYIGYVVCRKLVDQGYTVVNIDSKKRDIPGVTQYPFDLGSTQIEGLINILKPTTIIHMATPISHGAPSSYYSTHVVNTVKLLDYAVGAGVKNFVYSSSGCVNAQHDKVVIEQDNVNLNDSYKRSKGICELLIQDYAETHDINYAILRYLNVVGVATEYNHSKSADAHEDVIIAIARSIVYNTEFECEGNGIAARDYTHVSDVADAHVLAMQYINCNGRNEIFNIASGKTITIKQIIKEFEKQKHHVDVVYNNETHYNSLALNGSYAAKTLNFVPRHTISDIVSDVFAWEKRHRRKK